MGQLGFVNLALLTLKHIFFRFILKVLALKPVSGLLEQKRMLAISSEIFSCLREQVWARTPGSYQERVLLLSKSARKPPPSP